MTPRSTRYDAVNTRYTATLPAGTQARILAWRRVSGTGAAPCDGCRFPLPSCTCPKQVA